STAQRRWNPADGWADGEGDRGGDVVNGVGVESSRRRRRRRRRRDGEPYGVASPEVEVPRSVVRGSEQTRQDAGLESASKAQLEEEEKESGTGQRRVEEAAAKPDLGQAQQEVDEKEGGGAAEEGKVLAGNRGKNEEGPLDERLPYMLASLQRVALTVQDLQGRCARLSHALDDEPRPRPPPPSLSGPAHRAATVSSTTAANEGDSPRSRVAGVLGQLSALSQGQAASGGAQRRPTRQGAKLQQRSGQQQPSLRSNGRRERRADRPAIAVPMPVMLPPRQPPPVLQPPPSPHDHQQRDHAVPLPVATPVPAKALADQGAEAAFQPRTSHAAVSPVDVAKVAEGTTVHSGAASSSARPSAGVEVAAAGPLVSATPPSVEDAWNSPLGVGRAGLGFGRRGCGDTGSKDDSGGEDDGGESAGTNATTGPTAATSHVPRLSRRGSNSSAIAEILRKLREPPRAEGREAGPVLSLDATEGRVGTEGAAAEHRRTAHGSRRLGTTVAAANLDSDALPEWVPRTRHGDTRGHGRLVPQASWGAGDGQGGGIGRGGSSRSSAEEDEGGRRGGGEGGGGSRAAGFSLVSLVAGDIVRAQREEAARRRREKEAAVSAAVSAAASVATAAAAATAATATAGSRAPERRQSKEILLAASENAVAEAVRAAARVVAAEEAARSDASGSVAARIRKDSIDGMEAVKEAMAALEERRENGIDGSSASEFAGGKSRGETHPDLWDCLLQSGPTMSSPRRNELRSSSRPGTSVGVEAKADVDPENQRVSRGSSFADSTATQERIPLSVSGGGGGGGGGGVAEGEGEGRRRRRLAPAELQAQLLNELRLHDDLQDAELQADGLMAAQRVDEARQEARVAALLLRREKNSRAEADSLLEQKKAFEEALAHNDATHKARLRRLTREADEQAARQAETATVAVAAASAAALGAHGRQAGAAVAALAAAGVQAQNQQASAMAAQAAMFLQFQERAIQRGREMAQRAAGGGRVQKERDHLSDAGSPDEDACEGQDSAEERQMRDRSPENIRKNERQSRNDFDSLLEHSPVRNSHNILHPRATSSTAAAAAAARGRQQARDREHGFWSSGDSQSPERKGRRSAATARGSSRSDQARGGPRPHQSRNSGSLANGPRGSGRLSSSGGAGAGGRESSPGRHFRHSSDGFIGSAVAARRQQQGGAAVPAGRGSSSTGLGGGGASSRAPATAGDGGVVDEHDLDALLDYRMAALRDSTRRQQRPSPSPMEPLRRSGPVGATGR
ncbi:unnamed protein product, partial [Hapterophycus canaliculatus]